MYVELEMKQMAAHRGFTMILLTGITAGGFIQIITVK